MRLLCMQTAALRARHVLLWAIAAAWLGAVPAEAQTSLPRLRVDEQGRFLVKENGDVFVWIGETNWFFAEIDPARRDRMLDKRRYQGFTMLFVSARENLYSGEGGPYGDGIADLNEPWWDYLEEYVDEAARRGMYVGVTLGWWGHVKNNYPADLYRNGLEVAKRFNGKTNVIWLVAGEAGGHSRDGEIPRDKIEAIVKGIRDGDEDDKLLTIHADYRRSTSLNEDAKLVDFNNWQTSQWCCRDDLPRDDEREWTVWEAISFDYRQKYDTPSGVKPTLDAEAIYERNKDFCDATPFMIRRRAYFTILAGAFGHQYGAGGIWDTLDRPEECSGSYLDALEYEGAADMGHLSAFLRGLGNDLLKLRPNQEMIQSGQSESYDSHIQAAQASDGSYAVVYDADGGTTRLDLAGLTGASVRARWFNPRDGVYVEHDDGSPPAKSSDASFTAPSSGEDWVLLIEAVQ